MSFGELCGVKLRFGGLWHSCTNYKDHSGHHRASIAGHNEESKLTHGELIWNKRSLD